MNLYELTGQYAKLLEGDPETGEISDEALAEITDELHAKANGYAMVIRTFEGENAAIDAEIERLKERKVRNKKNIDRLTGNLQNAMKETGEVKFKTNLFSFTVARNGGKQPIEVNEKAVPMSYMKQIYQVDKDKIRAALEQGEDLSFAKLCERGESLRIK